MGATTELSRLTESYKPREEFGGRLRRLREHTGLNGKQFAARMGWPPSKVSKLETGWQTATVEDVRAWTEAAGCPTELLEDLLADLRSVRFEYATWRRQLRAGMAPRQRASTGVLAAATTIRAFEPAIIPGLLQTADYARHVLALAAEVHGAPNDVEAGVRARAAETGSALCRRQALPVRPHRGSPAVPALPAADPARPARFEVQLPLVPVHGFWIFDHALVLNETFNAELALRDTEDVALYERVFDAWWQVAAHGEDASGLIQRILHELRGPTN